MKRTEENFLKDLYYDTSTSPVAYSSFTQFWQYVKNNHPPRMKFNVADVKGWMLKRSAYIFIYLLTGSFSGVFRWRINCLCG